MKDMDMGLVVMIGLKLFLFSHVLVIALVKDLSYICMYFAKIGLSVSTLFYAICVNSTLFCFYTNPF